MTGVVFYNKGWDYEKIYIGIYGVRHQGQCDEPCGWRHHRRGVPKYCKILDGQYFIAYTGSFYGREF
jgi:hypothetical protein